MLSLLGSLRRGNFVQRSLRFRSSASAYLNRTPSVAGNRQIFTWSGWLKRGIISSGTHTLFAARNSTTDWQALRISAGDQIEFLQETVGPTFRRTSAVYRDPSAHFHVVLSVNTTDATTQNRIRIYVNGVEITAWATNATVSQNTNFAINNTVAHTVGRDADGGSYLDGYLTEVNFIDGQALTPSSFGQIESTTGVWSPKQYAGSYGTNGFYLKFGNTSSVAALGNDSSGNNNTWTVNNVSLTAGATYDSMLDVPVNYSDGGNGRGNYCTLNPLDKVGPGVSSNGNLNYSTSTSTNDPIRSTIAVSSGKWYWEVFCVGSSGTILNSYDIGVIDNSSQFTANISVGAFQKGYSYFGFNGNKYNNDTLAAYGSTYTTNDVIGVALDLDAGTLTFYKNNVSQGVAFTGLSGTFSPAISDGTLQGTISVAANFGQRPFTYTPPAGFKALNTNNLPTPSIVNGANFMAATTYTGNAAVRSLSNAVNNVSFQPDLVWIKSRTPGATNHALFDSSRGATKYLSSNTTTAETTLAQSLTALNADGFSLGTDTTLVNASANSYVAWQWKAGGAAVSNTQGTITSQVSANTTAGFSVVTWVGNLTSGATVGHSLGVAPKLIIFFNRSIVGERPVYSSVIGAANYLYINATNASAAFTGFFNNTAPTASVFSLGNDARTNGSGNNLVAYCFAEIAGFSKFGSYTGNGSADGPFVFCGFRPRFVMIKRTDVANDWVILDTSRNTYNFADSILWADLANTETAGTATTSVDCLSNGFKSRGAGASINATSGTYIFAAFAEVPSKYALAR